MAATQYDECAVMPGKGADLRARFLGRAPSALHGALPMPLALCSAAQHQPAFLRFMAADKTGSASSRCSAAESTSFWLVGHRCRTATVVWFVLRLLVPILRGWHLLPREYIGIRRACRLCHRATTQYQPVNRNESKTKGPSLGMRHDSRKAR